MNYTCLSFVAWWQKWNLTSWHWRRFLGHQVTSQSQDWQRQTTIQDCVHTYSVDNKPVCLWPEQPTKTLRVTLSTIQQPASRSLVLIIIPVFSCYDKTKSQSLKLLSWQSLIFHLPFHVPFLFYIYFVMQSLFIGDCASKSFQDYSALTILIAKKLPNWQNEVWEMMNEYLLKDTPCFYFLDIKGSIGPS